MACRRSIHPPEEDFPMTPMIDMVFLLLVFFMTVSTLAQADRQVELELPESASSDVPNDLSDRGTISIDATGQIYMGSIPQTLQEMQRLLKKSLTENSELRIHLRADRTTEYQYIKEEVGAYEVIYATYQSR
jgi:biopolymer transport protein ExbD